MVAIANLVREITGDTGPGAMTLTAVDGAQTFAAAFGTGGATNQFFYFIANRDAPEYAGGTGHLSASGALVRDTETFGSGALPVAFTAGTKDVVNDLPAAQQVNRSELGALAFLSAVPDGSITLAKMADLARYSLIGRSTVGTGVPEVLASSANVYSILTAADYAAVRSLLSLGTAALATIGTSGDTVPKNNTSNVFSAEQFIQLPAFGVNFQIQTTDNGANGVIEERIHSSASPAVSDIIYTINYYGKDSGGNTTAYVSSSAIIVDPTDGSEDGQFRWNVTVAGVSGTKMLLGDGLALGSAPADPGLGAINATATVRTGQYLVANLPAAATAGAGARAFVTNALGPTFGSAVVGGGAVAVPVYSTGSAWNVG